MALRSILAIPEAAMPSLVGPETSVFWDWVTSSTVTSDYYAAQNDVIQVFTLAPDWVVDTVKLGTSGTLGAGATLKVVQFDNDGLASNPVDLTAATTAATASLALSSVVRKDRSPVPKGVGLVLAGGAIGAIAKVSLTFKLVHGPSWRLV
jgi:hypothetical protein